MCWTILTESAQAAAVGEASGTIADHGPAGRVAVVSSGHTIGERSSVGAKHYNNGHRYGDWKDATCLVRPIATLTEQPPGLRHEAMRGSSNFAPVASLIKTARA